MKAALGRAVATRCLLIAGLVFVGWAGGVAAQEKSDEALSIASWAEENLRALGGNTLIVIPFPYVDGIKSVEGALIVERVVTKLTENGFARIVEREQLDKVMAEQKLSASGLVDPASSVKIGKLLGARGILSGTVTDLGENIEVHARLLNVESGQVASTTQCTVPKAIKTFISPLWSEIERIKKESKNFNVKFWADKGQESTEISSYRVGDFATFHFEADRDCYVTIFDFTSSGSIHVLFPNAFHPDGKIKAGRTYTFPDAQAGFKIRVKDPPGIERLKLFATTKNVKLFEEDYSQEKFRSISSDNYSVTRDLEAVIDSLDGNAWAEAGLEIRIEQILRGK